MEGANVYARVFDFVIALCGNWVVLEAKKYDFITSIVCKCDLYKGGNLIVAIVKMPQIRDSNSNPKV